ncbi:hypothetical protein LP316_01800 [Thalassotalea sp. LPB0316]|uniref:hypothetical protein n=1 Tax=Thalassotalea sp. LPB0316 TaxID=2769490 RepID=UPI0018667069|nr:hypothetical protein [Thalassotalea sp. LPB0316]QOL26067.1 hypothetical protein LP316_01800 [Thalassotalea sp. LPB0316]
MNSTTTVSQSNNGQSYNQTLICTKNAMDRNNFKRRQQHQAKRFTSVERDQEKDFILGYN